VCKTVCKKSKPLQILDLQGLKKVVAESKGLPRLLPRLGDPGGGFKGKSEEITSPHSSVR